MATSGGQMEDRENSSQAQGQPHLAKQDISRLVSCCASKWMC